MLSAFESLPDDMIYNIRTYLDFTAEMALDSTSKTIRAVMRDVVQPRCKILDVDKELDPAIEFPRGIDVTETFRKYAEKVSKHLTVFKNMDSGVFLFPPKIANMPKLRHVCFTPPMFIEEHIPGATHMFSDAAILFWKRIWEYLESRQLESLLIYEPSTFTIGDVQYECTPAMADRIYIHALEEIYVHEPNNASNRLEMLRLPRNSVSDFGVLYDLFPNARIECWETMDPIDIEKQATLNRLLIDAF
jgi:hypothetical protein